VRDSQVTDTVTVTLASYSLTTRALTVNAVSSDQAGTPSLVASGSPLEPLGTLTAGVLTVPLAAPPHQVNVTSSAGGTGNRLLDLVP